MPTISHYSYCLKLDVHISAGKRFGRQRLLDNYKLTVKERNVVKKDTEGKYTMLVFDNRPFSFLSSSHATGNIYLDQRSVPIHLPN